MAETSRDARLSAEDIARWCSLVLGSIQPGSVFYVGSQAPVMVQQFQRAGINAAGYDPGLAVALQPGGISTGVACDVLVIHQDALGAFLEISPQEFYSLFGSPRQVFLALQPGEGEPVLPAASKWLWDMGFGRDFSVELWIDDRLLTVAYCPEMRHADSVALYEAECWRLSLLAQKRRLVAQEYLQELVQAEYYKMRWKSLTDSLPMKLLKGWVSGARRLARFPRSLIKR